VDFLGGFWYGERMSDPLKDHFVRTVPRGSELPERGIYLGDVFVLMNDDGSETIYEWNGRRWASAAAQPTIVISNPTVVMTDDGTALSAADHPQDTELLEFCRAHRGAMAAFPTTPHGAALVARLINAYLLLVDTDLSESSLTHALIEVEDARVNATTLLLRALIRQIELGSYTDEHGHKLTNNVCFIKAKEAVGE
jgi:hypothetical protein